MDQLIIKLKSNPDFIEFTEYVVEKIDEMDSVDGLESMTNEEAGEEAKVRIKAKTKLIQILRPFIEFRERKPPTETEIKKAGEKFGL